MKSPNSLLVPLAAACVLLVACQSNTKRSSGNPRSASHWNAGFASESATFHAMSANSYTPDTIRQTGQQSSSSMVKTWRRHFFNDNPDNPLQEHRYGPYDRYIPIVQGPVYAVGDGWDMVRTGGVNAWQGLISIVWLPVQLIIGTGKHDVETSQPPEPEQFEVAND